MIHESQSPDFDADVAATAPFYLADVHEECWSRLLYVIEQGWPLATLTGPAQVGKSMLLAELARQSPIPPGGYWLTVDASGRSSGELVDALVEATNAIPSGWTSLEDWLAGAAYSRIPSVWIIDHFDQGTEDLSLTVRRLLRLTRQTHNRSTIIVAAREADAIAALHDVSELSCELSPWDRSATQAYLEHQIAQRGLFAVFSPSAVQAVFDCTSGLAGRIRRLCELCLLAADVQGLQQIDVDLVIEVWSELARAAGERSYVAGR